jgi:hypothetical protein
MTDIMKTLTDLLTYDHNEFLTELDGNVLEMATELESYFYENEPTLMIAIDGDVNWLDVAIWIQDAKKEMGL